MPRSTKLQKALDSRWTSKWIRYGWGKMTPLLRLQFKLYNGVSKAYIQFTALGVCEVRINGKKIGYNHLTPGWTDYKKRVYYFTHDVTRLLRDNQNTVASILGNGWFSGCYGPFDDRGFYGHDSWFSARLFVLDKTDNLQIFDTNEDWVGQPGPIQSSDLLHGEIYDARKEVPGWDNNEPESGNWQPVTLISYTENKPDKIEKHPAKGIKTVQELKPASHSEIADNQFIYDFGQNMVGVVKLNLKNCLQGTEIKLRHSEVLNKDGSLYTKNLRTAKATDIYICKGSNHETWQPRFTFHGFRYVEITGLSEPLDYESISAQVWMSDMKETLSISTSKEKLNKLINNIKWSFRGNYLDVPTDCPQRDERLGWTGDTQIFIKSACYLADVRQFHDKWLQDLSDAQREDGAYPDVAPSMGRLGYNSPGWSDAGIICPYQLWQQFNHTQPIRKHWKEMNRYMDSISIPENRHNSPEIISYGDWLCIGNKTPDYLIGMAYKAWNCKLMHEMATEINDQEKKEHYQDKYISSKEEFRLHALKKSENLTQTLCALAIYMDLVAGDDLKYISTRLIELVEENNGYLVTGFIGTAYLCPALSKIGRSDLAMNILLNEECPSWLYEVINGATTIWERWNSWTIEDGFGDEGMNSFNHYAFGAILEWIINYLAGIQPIKPGFSEARITPYITDKLEHFSANFTSIHGDISISWKKLNKHETELHFKTPVPTQLQLTDIRKTKNLSPGEYSYLISHNVAREICVH